jgi:multiple sugar transport system permease protein
MTATQEAAVAARERPAPARPPRRLLPTKRTRFHLLLMTPAILLGVLVLGYPLYLVISASLKDIGILSPSLLASAPTTTQNYKELGSDPNFTQAIRNSVIYTIGSTVPAGVLGLLTALLLNQRFRFRRVFRTLLLLPWAVPTVVASFLFLWVLNASYGVLNYVLKQLHLIQQYIPWLASPHWALVGVIIPTVWKSYPFFCLLILAALQTIPAQLYEAAAVDGAGAWARFRAVTWPGISSAVYLAAVLQALWAFREFEVIYPMTAGGPAGSTQTLAIYLYNEAFQFFHLGYASALGVVTIGICVIFVAIAYPRMRRNLSRS